MSDNRRMTSDGHRVGVGDWVTNDDPMLGEPHEIVASADFHWVCCESAGHVVRVHWADPTLRLSADPNADYPRTEGET